MSSRLIKQAGDTIVEVLLAIAILGVILAGAYVTANRSLNSEHDAQEHSQALTIAQAQIEDLHAGYNLKNPSSGITNQCFDITPSIDTGGKYCYENPAGNFCLTSRANDFSSCAQTAPFWYNISDQQISQSTIQLNAADPTQTVTLYTYKITVTWPGVLDNTSSVQLYYRTE